MTAPDERTEARLREALGRHPRPSLPRGFAAAVLQRVAARERREHAGRRRGARLVSWGCWLAAFGACAWILGRNPMPERVVALMFALATAAVPVSFAALLWPRQARTWLVACLRPFAPLAVEPRPRG